MLNKSQFHGAGPALNRRNVLTASAAVGGGGLLTGLTASRASARASQSVSLPSPEMQGELASTSGLIPSLFVSPDGDLVAKPGSNLDSWFLVLRVDSARGKLDILVHFLHVKGLDGGPGMLAAMVSLLDPRTNKYIAEEKDFPGDKCSFSTKNFEVICPIASAYGTTSGLTFKGKWAKAGISLDVRAKQTGPMLPNLGGGLFPALGGTTYHYALSTMSAMGTLTLGGEVYEITGDAWLDRQWGHVPRFFSKDAKRWAWFGIMLDNGDRISVWEFLEADRPVHSWATIVHANGGVEVVACEPLTANASRPWKSPQTGHVYPTVWDIRMPAVDGRLIATPDVIEQEFVSPAGMHKYEGFSSISGTLRGQQVTGRVIIELVADWL